MTAKEYLSQLIIKREEIAYLNELQQDCIDKATSMSVHMDEERVQTSRVDNGRVERYGTQAANISQEIEKKQWELLTLEDKIMKQIQGLHQADYIQILFKMYVQGKNAKSISAEMNRSVTWILKKHDEALSLFRECYARKKKVVKNGTENNITVNETTGRVGERQAADNGQGS